MDAKVFLPGRPHLVPAPVAPPTVMYPLPVFGTPIGVLGESDEGEQVRHRSQFTCHS